MLYFDRAEYGARLDRLVAAMAEKKLDAVLLFAQASLYWLTGYDTLGNAFFQVLVVTKERRLSLMTRAGDMRQARQTSIVGDVVAWTDRPGADPTKALKDHLFALDLLGARIGVEADTPGLTGRNGRLLDEQLRAFATAEDASDLVARLRLTKSPAEISMVRHAAGLADAAWSAAMERVGPGADEAAIAAALTEAMLAAGGDTPAQEFVVGSGRRATLTRPHSGREVIADDDQLTLMLAGSWRRYHAALADTVVVGRPREKHRAMWDACAAGLSAGLAAMRPGNTFGQLYEAVTHAFQEHGMGLFRQASCGSSLGASFPPTFIDWPMVTSGNPAEIGPDMVIHLVPILTDPETETAMAIGRSYLTTAGEPELLSAHPPAFLAR